MAIIKNSTPFDSIQKKFSGSDEIHFRNRKKDNATIGVRVKNPYDGGNSEAQQAVRNQTNCSKIISRKLIFELKNSLLIQSFFLFFLQVQNIFKLIKF